jgi:hypothetical protein
MNTRFCITNNIINKLTNGSISDINDVIGNTESGIHVFVNDIYENCLVVVNDTVLMKQEYVSLNNVDIFEENYGLYYGTTKDTEDIYFSSDTFGKILSSGQTITGDQVPSNINDIEYNSDYDELYCATPDGLWMYEFSYKEGTLVNQDNVNLIDLTDLIQIEYCGDYIYVLNSTGETKWYNISTLEGNNIIESGYTFGVANSIELDSTNDLLYSDLSDYIHVFDTVTLAEKVVITGMTSLSLYNGYDGFDINKENNFVVLYGDWGFWRYDISTGLGTWINSGTTSITGQLLPDNDIDELLTAGDYICCRLGDDLWIYNISTNTGTLRSNCSSIKYIDSTELIYNYLINSEYNYYRLTLSTLSNSYLDFFSSDFAVNKVNDRYYFSVFDTYYYLQVYGNGFNTITTLNSTSTGYTCENPENMIPSLNIISTSDKVFIANSQIQIIEFNYGSTNQYNPDFIIAKNYVDTLNEITNFYGFDKATTYHHIDSDGVYKKYYMTGTTQTPFLLQISRPGMIRTKKESFEITPIEGPEKNILNYQRPGEEIEEGDIIDEPLGRSIELNEEYREDTAIQHGESPEFVNRIFRYNANYEPIFKNIAIFNKIDYDESNNYTIYDRNYRFEDDYTNFATISELIYSKVNEVEGNVLKLKDEYNEKSIYPMVDEFGYGFTKRFIFKSNWDSDFFIRTTKNIE